MSSISFFKKPLSSHAVILFQKQYVQIEWIEVLIK